MPRQLTGFLILCLVAVQAIIAQQTADTAANAKTKQILAYIAGLPKQGKQSSNHTVMFEVNK